MRTIKVTTKTAEQIAADFAATFGAIEPDGAALRITQKERLEPYRKEIMKQRRRGLSWKQIAAGMRGPRIAEPITEKILKAVFEPPKSVSGPAKPPPTKFYIDPATGTAYLTDVATGQKYVWDSNKHMRYPVDPVTGKPSDIGEPFQ